MSTPGERLRAERLRLGLSQEAFGAIGGVRKQAQIKYEKGERRPNAEYLTAVAEAGVDVDFVLTGTPRVLREALQDVQVATQMSRALGGTPEERLQSQQTLFDANQRARDEERRLLESYRACDVADRARILELAERLRKPAPSKGNRTPRKLPP